MEKNLLMIEYEKILKKLSQETVNQETKARILNIRPAFNDIQRCKELMGQTDDAYILSSKYGSPSFLGLKNIIDIVKGSTVGTVLSTHQLLLVLSVLKTAENIRTYKKQFSELITSLDNYFNQISVNTHLKEKIEKAILSEDEISDSASSRLYDIRRKIRNISLKNREKLENFIRNPKSQKYLQEPIITIRDTRFVLPVKSEYKEHVKGIVHDISSSGATVFIEPLFIVEDNNILGSLRAEEKYEIENILKDLSKEVSNFSDSILKSYNALIDLEVIFAKANFGYKLRGCVPKFNNNGKIVLKKVRHPLIPKDKVVPIDISLGVDFDTLIITGSNTGGKTVVLKTVGLICAMGMSGLMVPAESGSEINVFDNILVDIGDEQSIEQSLSTFSSHMKNIISILKQATNKTLVLLDEIGSGTSPSEGSTLAQSIIEKLEKIGSKVIVTTHYKQLKEYAVVKDRVENACCEFDITNLSPTYRLIIGVPGNSYAFLITEKLGLGKDIIDRAKGLIDNQEITFEEIVNNLEGTRKSLEEELEFTQKEHSKYNKLKRDLEEKIEKFERQKNYESEKYKYEARRLLDKVRTLTDDLISDIKQIRKNNMNMTSEKRRDIYSKLRNIENTADPINEIVSEPNDSKFKIGDRVNVFGIEKEGEVVSVDCEDNLVVQVGNMKLNLSKTKVKRLDKVVNRPKGRVGNSVRVKRTSGSFSEIDLRGKTVLEAIQELDMFIDSSILAKISTITVIHGKGTGKLRSEISKYLSKNRSVLKYRLGTFGEGETGVTIVELKI